MSLTQMGLFIYALGVTGVLGQTCTDCKDRAQGHAGDTCTSLVTWLECIEGSGDGCPAEETNGVTFQQVIKVVRDDCLAFAPLVSGELCVALTTCLQTKTRFFEVLVGSPETVKDSPKTGFWCRALEGTLNCAIKTGEECKVEDIGNLEKKLKNTNDVCDGNGGTNAIHGQAMTMVLALLAAALVLGLICG